MGIDAIADKSVTDEKDLLIIRAAESLSDRLGGALVVVGVIDRDDDCFRGMRLGCDCLECTRRMADALPRVAEHFAQKAQALESGDGLRDCRASA